MAMFPPIAINYIAASAFGFSINNNASNFTLASISPWIFFSVIIGIMLIGNFYLIGHSTQRAGIGITTVSAKMSFAIPVTYSLFFDINDNVEYKKIALILLAIASVAFVIYPKNYEPQKAGSILFPVLIFFGLGILDGLVKYNQYHFITTSASSALFSAFNFCIAAIIGISILLFNKKQRHQILNIKVILTGVALGIANFGSMYFLINALNELKFNNSLVFGINNIGIVLTSVMAAIIIYKEKFSRINWFGLMLSLLVLLCMIYIFV